MTTVNDLHDALTDPMATAAPAEQRAMRRSAATERAMFVGRVPPNFSPAIDSQLPPHHLDRRRRVQLVVAHVGWF